MEVSVSLPGEDAEFLDRYAEVHGLASRSAALRRAVHLLRTSERGIEYEDAWTEWAGAGEATIWGSTVSDGLG